MVHWTAEQLAGGSRPTEFWDSASPVQGEAAWRYLGKPFLGSVASAALLCEAVQGTSALGEVPSTASHHALQQLGAMETMC